MIAKRVSIAALLACSLGVTSFADEPALPEYNISSFRWTNLPLIEVGARIEYSRSLPRPSLSSMRWTNLPIVEVGSRVEYSRIRHSEFEAKRKDALKD